ncbi:unnamed protein product [Rotaria sordida]|uniref:Uncharacterized protein n=2 Tax=Rotaria sordida TaxID=392033 RepID=A0A818KBL4_9BILA|nr:unnamed protein product [Rotaria sordida]CAF0935250.1 unnamed protein product [Rotaria sordida]CAF1044391.1 unnamed protein product [Rotaria sordida]CAF1307698.1 unnamed protein product [Rotaria sordida]CAF1449236.1 unnamed protein product [Rotaria sordida]
MAQYSIPASSTQRQQMSIEIPRPLPSFQRPSVGGPPFSNVFDEHIDSSRLPRLNIASERQIKFLPPFVSLILGSKYFLIALCILLIVPILELAIGIAYQDQCSVNPNIPRYLIVTGACGLMVIALTIMIVGSFVCCVKQDTIAGSCITTCIIAMLIIIIFLMSLFLFVWFIVGNVWIFGAQNIVDFRNEQSSNYCHSTLYNFAFWILIITYIMTVVCCCLSCCCACSKSVATLKA